MIHYVCKYTPLELFKGFGEECAVLEEMPENFELSDQIAHANLCGFGKSAHWASAMARTRSRQCWRER